MTLKRAACGTSIEMPPIARMRARVLPAPVVVAAARLAAPPK